uniref:Uncharacterized protein n=1 Tax=Cicer arietinum TaxID=3827 RepID=A0A1S2Z600_CICAR|nr:putative uncharacterized protein DDB_G0290521 [Cicer arietinum]
MARTKITRRKNPSSLAPSSSPSPSPVCSPSPPPRPTPPHSSTDRTFFDYMSSSPESSPPSITLEPLATILPPLYQCTLHSISQAPPHLHKSLNPSSSIYSSKRRSMQVLAGIGTSKSKNIDTTIYKISYDDTEPSPPPQIPKSLTAHTSQPSKPSKKSPSKVISSKNTPSKTKPMISKSNSSSTLSQFLTFKK